MSGDLDPSKLAELAAEHHPIKDTFLSLIDALKQTQLTSSEKRQLAEAEKGVAILLKRLARGDIPGEIVEKVSSLTGCITSYDFRSAQSIQTGLVNTDWRDHKDWLKGIKALLQLASKKYL